MSKKEDKAKEDYGYKPKPLPDAGHSPRDTRKTKPPKGGTGESQ
ncbi:hypothetical protein [Alkalihalobacillus sp. TS-13]|nr:hypothetical protein [Alkalihalobacillus sp. TS-13]